MHNIHRLIKQFTLRAGIYLSIFVSILILLTLITTLIYKGIEPLQKQYVQIKNEAFTHDTMQIKSLLKQFLDKQHITDITPEMFNIKKAIISKQQILIPINTRLTPQTTIQNLITHNLIITKWDFSFFRNNDSTNAQNAGIFNSIIGSLLTIVVCIIFAVPLGVATAIYLEEFAPKNGITSFIEINIKNLAAIPSVVYGLLGLILFINIMQINRSSSLVGGLTLAMMAIPIIMTITQQALRSVPQRIREGALALGSSKIQLLFNFLLPISMPTIITGIVLAISRIIGETAPLLIVGMTAFVTKTPTTFFEPTTTLPTQIYLWSDNIDGLFIGKSCLAILLLLFILFIINAIALYLKSKSSNHVK